MTVPKGLLTQLRVLLRAVPAVAVISSHALPTSVIDMGSASRASISFEWFQTRPPPPLLFFHDDCPPPPGSGATTLSEIKHSGQVENENALWRQKPARGDCTVLCVRKRAWVFRMSHGAPARRAIAVVITLQCTSIAYAAAKTPQYQLRASGQARASCPVCKYAGRPISLCACV